MQIRASFALSFEEAEGKEARMLTQERHDSGQARLRKITELEAFVPSV